MAITQMWNALCIWILLCLLSLTTNVSAGGCASFVDEAKAVQCGAALAAAHFSGPGGAYELPGWTEACRHYRHFEKCSDDLSAECRSGVMSNVQRVWSELCAQDALFDRLANQEDCIRLIDSNNTLQTCFRQYTIDLYHFTDELCDVAEKRFHCFAEFEDLAKCKNIAEVYRDFYDALITVIRKPKAAKDENSAVASIAKSPKSTKLPKLENTVVEMEMQEDSACISTESLNPTKTVITTTKTTTEKTTKPATSTETTRESMTTNAINLTTTKVTAETTEKATTTQSTKTINSKAIQTITTVAIIETAKAQRSAATTVKTITTNIEPTASPTKETTMVKTTTIPPISSTVANATKRVRRAATIFNDKKSNLQCSYRSVDEMAATYRRQKEQRALGGCFEVNADGVANANLSGITVQLVIDDSDDDGNKPGKKLICGCLSGYRIDPANRQCVDIDECEEGTHLCSQLCENRKGGYDCLCESRFGAIYMLSTRDNRTCKRNVNESALISLVFAHGQSIWNVSEDGHFVEQKLNGLEKAAMIDIDVRRDIIYFVDSGRGIIERFANESIKPEIVQNYEVDGVEGIAVDYISQTLYSVRRSDIFAQTIRSNGTSFRKRLYKGVLSTPRALVAHATSGWLFGSDWSSEAFIYRAAMDGSGFEKIITTDIVWPNGLAVDHYASRLYWADAFLDFIQSTNFDGTHRRTIIAKSDAVAHVFGLAVADNFIYWTDWNHRGILRANKLTGSNVTLLAQTTLLPYGLKVFHKVDQPMIDSEANPCDKLKCDHLCLRVPANASSPARNNVSAICACANGYSLEEDGHTCRPDCREPAQNVIVCGGSEPKCVNKRNVCDGIQHCPDRLDERNCPTRVCPLGEFQCVDEPTRCLDAAVVCDGRSQCRDSSDERFCDLRRKSTNRRSVRAN